MKYSLLAALLLLLAGLIACSSKTQPNATAKRYHLKGKVISIDKTGKMATIDGEEIPGFMGAMTMPYPVKPASELDKLSPGDVISADIVVQDDNPWLENIVVTSKPSPAK